MAILVDSPICLLHMSPLHSESVRSLDFDG